MILQQLWRKFAPPWMLDGPNIGTFYESVGALLDSISQRVLDGRIAAIPWAGPGVGVEQPLTSTGQRLECQPDAIPYHSLDRAIPLYATEGLLSRRVKLASFRQLHARRGTHWGEIEHARAYFEDAVAAGLSFPRMAIVFQTNEATPTSVWTQIDSDGTRTLRRAIPSNFNFDDRPSLRTRWWAIIDLTGTGYEPPFTWDDGVHTWNGGSLWDSSDTRPLTASVVSDLTSIFSEWHSAHSWLAGIYGWWSAGGGAPWPAWDGVPTQDASGWWSLPNGAGTWGSLVDPATGKATLPPNMTRLYDNPPP